MNHNHELVTKQDHGNTLENNRTRRFTFDGDSPPADSLFGDSEASISEEHHTTTDTPEKDQNGEPVTDPEAECAPEPDVDSRSTPDPDADVASLPEYYGHGTDTPPPPSDKKKVKEPFKLEAMDSREFAQTVYQRKFLVRGVLVEGQPTIFGGPKKSLKTSIGVDLHISCASGTDFLGYFKVERPVRTLFLSGESDEGTVQEVAQRVCLSKGITLESLGEQARWGFKLPRLSVEEELKALGDDLRKYQTELVTIDPLYLCLLSGNTSLDEKSLFDMGPLLVSVFKTCLDAGATPSLSHHFRKYRDNPHELPELEDLAFAGIQESARQWILVGRRETFEPGSGEHKLWLVVGGSAGHSGGWALNVSEGATNDNLGGRYWDVSVVPAAQVRSETQDVEQGKRAEKKLQRELEKEEANTRKAEEHAPKTLAVLRKLKQATASKWRGETKLNSDDFKLVRIFLQETGQVRECTVVVPSGKKGTRETDGYEPTTPSPDPHPTTPDHTRPTPDQHPTWSGVAHDTKTPDQGLSLSLLGERPVGQVVGCADAEMGSDPATPDQISSLGEGQEDWTRTLLDDDPPGTGPRRRGFRRSLDS